MRSLLGTTILVYAESSNEPIRQPRAIELIKQLRTEGSAVLSTQVLQASTKIALRKLRLPAPVIRDRLAFYSRFDVVITTPELIATALDRYVLNGLSFFDALIVQAAIAGGCQRLLSEDMHDGGSFGGVQIVNLFTA